MKNTQIKFKYKSHVRELSFASVKYNGQNIQQSTSFKTTINSSFLMANDVHGRPLQEVNNVITERICTIAVN